MSSSTRPLRADAARNRALLLAAAEDEFVERGLEASVADIARRAGVAKGTVFRHFATKEALIAAVVRERLATLAAVARELHGGSDAGADLLAFMTHAADARRQRDLTFLLSVSADDPQVRDVGDELHAAIGALVDRARTAGAIRADVTEGDVFLLLCAPVHVVENHPDPPEDLWRRYLAILFDGLRPDGAHALPAPPPVLS
ncbi:TetR/AcrR family transcriptional regulator [Patulibacter sp. SYSU D01012]|uniref:TetR/AcrR family transcriptional regulator n=1 Tax=Patulibacter sp. SYSU D01012 TaxID=2817381 RepID=UPI001B312966